MDELMCQVNITFLCHGTFVYALQYIFVLWMDWSLQRSERYSKGNNSKLQEY